MFMPYPLHPYSSLANYNYMDWLWPKFNPFTDKKLNIANIMIFVIDQVENIMGRRENAGYQHFLLFQKFFQKASSSGLLKVGLVW